VAARGNVDAEFVRLVKHVCLWPAMHVGRVSFELTATFLSGYSLGHDGYKLGAHDASVLHGDFQRFLVAKYGREAARRLGLSERDGPLYVNIVWWAIYGAHFPHDSDEEQHATLSQDFEDFANPLVRLVTEMDAGD